MAGNYIYPDHPDGNLLRDCEPEPDGVMRNVVFPFPDSNPDGDGNRGCFLYFLRDLRTRLRYDGDAVR